MQFIYKIPGYILCLLAGLCLSFGGPLIRSFEGAGPWQILFWRSLFFLLALITFLILIYKKEALNIIKKSGFVSSKMLSKNLQICSSVYKISFSVKL